MVCACRIVPISHSRPLSSIAHFDQFPTTLICPFQIPENGTKEEQQQAAQLSSQISITLSEVFQKLFDLRR